MLDEQAVTEGGGPGPSPLWWLIAALAFVAIFLTGGGVTSGIVLQGAYLTT